MKQGLPHLMETITRGQQIHTSLMITEAGITALRRGLTALHQEVQKGIMKDQLLLVHQVPILLQGHLRPKDVRHIHRLVPLLHLQVHLQAAAIRLQDHQEEAVVQVLQDHHLHHPEVQGHHQAEGNHPLL